jgi:hypothetical protein
MCKFKIRSKLVHLCFEVSEDLEDSILAFLQVILASFHLLNFVFKNIDLILLPVHSKDNRVIVLGQLLHRGFHSFDRLTKERFEGS